MSTNIETVIAYRSMCLEKTEGIATIEDTAKHRQETQPHTTHDTRRAPLHNIKIMNHASTRKERQQLPADANSAGSTRFPAEKKKKALTAM